MYIVAISSRRNPLNITFEGFNTPREATEFVELMNDGGDQQARILNQSNK